MVSKAVILAAGSASRMQEHIERYVEDGEVLDAVRRGEKMAARFSRFPFLDYLILNLVRAGMERVNIVLRQDDVFFTTRYAAVGRAAFPEVEISFSWQKTPEGTSRAVLAAERFAGGDRFIVLNGDNHYPVRLVRTLAESRAGSSSLVAFDTRGFGDTSRGKLKSYAVLATEGGRLRGIVEKPEDPGRFAVRDLLWGAGDSRVRVENAVLVSMNLWCFGPGIFDACRDAPRHAPRKPGKPGEYELPDAVRLFMERGEPFRVYYANEDVLDLTRAEDIELVDREIRGTLADAIVELERRHRRPP